MSEATPTFTYPESPPVSVSDGPSVAELCAAARTVIQPMLDSEQRFDPAVECGFIELGELVDRFEKRHVVGKVASYHLNEALETVKRISEAGYNERDLADDRVRKARESLAAIAVVPQVIDLVEGLIDREIRDTVRGLSAAKRSELLEQMRTGDHVRAMLAAARSPMPTELDIEAAKLYAQFSEPSKRRDLSAMESIYRAKRAAAQSLEEAADAAKAIVAQFIKLEVKLMDREASAVAQLQATTITRPGTEYRLSSNQPARWPSASVQVEGSSITRVA